MGWPRQSKTWWWSVNLDLSSLQHSTLEEGHSQAFPPSSIYILYHMNDISVYLGRQSRGEGSPIKRTHFAHTLFRSGTFFGSQMLETPVLGAARKYKIKPQACPFIGGPLPPSVYLGRH